MSEHKSWLVILSCSISLYLCTNSLKSILHVFEHEECKGKDKKEAKKSSQINVDGTLQILEMCTILNSAKMNIASFAISVTFDAFTSSLLVTQCDNLFE